MSLLNLTANPSAYDKFMIQTSDGLITLTVYKSPKNKNRVRLGFEAPKKIKIDREKIYNLKQG
jgi:sRNA-binding carbon storage regulator CsrA